MVGEGAAGAFGDAPGGGVEVFGVPGVHVGAVMVRAEFQIGDGQAHLQEHPFIKCFYLPNFRGDDSGGIWKPCAGGRLHPRRRAGGGARKIRVIA